MDRVRYRPLLLLFALVLPSVVIVILGWKMIERDQDWSLARKNTKLEFEKALRTALDLIRLGELDGLTKGTGKYSDAAVAFVASVSRGLVEFPRDSEMTAQRSLGASLQKDFYSLNLKEGEWKSYGTVWLCLTPPVDDYGKQLLIAVRSEEFANRVRLELKPKGPWNDFTIEPLPDECRNTNLFDSLYNSALPSNQCQGVPLTATQSPNLQIAFKGGDPGTRFVVNWSRTALLVLVICFALLSGFFLWRDTNQKARNVEMHSQFLSYMSHELRTPLTGIQIFAETLRDRGSTNPQIQQEYLDTIVHETKRLTRLVSNVLDFSSIENVQKNYHPAVTPLGDVVRSAADAMRSMLSMQGFSLRVDICDKPPQMRIDRDALQQAIINLLNNSMKYSGSSRNIDLRLLYDGNYALVEVTDYGVGIATKELSRIFERSYRIETKENRAIGGAGLGLAIVAYIARTHGGSVYVDSIPGKGSTFSIRIPVEGKRRS